jgi:hypothetical protein
MAPEDHFKHFFEIVNRRDLEALGEGLAEEGAAEPVSGWILVQELPPHMDHEFRFFRIACPEL